MSNEKCCDKCDYPGDLHENSHGVRDPNTAGCGNDSCLCHTPSTDTMEERLSSFEVDKFEDVLRFEGSVYHPEGKVLRFAEKEISLALQKRNEELVGKVEALRKGEFNNHYSVGHSHAIGAVLELLKQP